jgi:hypothetical protein
VPHDLVCALEDLVHPDVAHMALQRVRVEVAVPAVQLESVVADLGSCLRPRSPREMVPEQARLDNG